VSNKIALPVIWQIPDDLWRCILMMLPPEKPRGSCGRPPLSYRRVLNGILYVLRTGCQWNAVPRRYGSGSSIHRYFQAWVALGIFRRIWALVLQSYDKQCRIGWDWQSCDGTMLKAPLGGGRCGPNPTDRRKSGTNGTY
jgi:putative transposase